jgi:hypothetical protein
LWGGEDRGGSREPPKNPDKATSGGALEARTGSGAAFGVVLS